MIHTFYLSGQIICEKIITNAKDIIPPIRCIQSSRLLEEKQKHLAPAIREMLFTESYAGLIQI